MINKKITAITLTLVLLVSCLVFTNSKANAWWIFGDDEKETAKKVEIFSWWTGGGEEEGLQALYDVFKKKNPNIKIINAVVAGGAGSNAKAVLKTRMVGGNPPDSFQVHGGAELIENYVKTGLMQPLTGLLEKWGVKNKFNQQILEMCSYKGKIYSIPLDVHRGNVLWYNKDLLQKYNIQPPTTLSSFIAALEKIDKQGNHTPLALGDKNKWTATHLFEDVLLATLGAKKYNGLWEGTTSFDHPKVREALIKFGKIMDYVNDDHAALTWQDATKRVYDGEAVFNVMGDWAEGYFKTLGWKPNEDFGWLTTPGSKGNFMVVTDTFGLPKKAPHPKGAKAWLKTVASLKGQVTFNKIKGAIPARIDADRSNFDPYLTDSMKDFASTTLAPSIVHGSAAAPGFVTALNDAINAFVTVQDVDATLKAIQDAANKYLK
ncbi:ABC-type sugar transport system, periplasmic component [Halobacteroides halobius DSM 5150]|uniref:Probable sugar-binding periplasmic protein n=1 Tax=Halobacteroides halobius (strain ATCC 35273 / DSM 5150 / MD-1) TaxID=748449 RepID=L0K8B7_HALHC|nr:ABC transporter substrate-binding protein [Halobacteroides halobius]AGB41266.1 ABC-type sugar transport system, periplasmic component [Halobacteroides halobius DSM 5150]